MAKKRNESVENRIRELRARHKLTQADLAKLVDVSRQSVVAIEKGEYNPSVLLALKIARVLQEPVESIFSIRDDRGEG